jgi:hypothetical protein
VAWKRFRLRGYATPGRTLGSHRGAGARAHTRCSGGAVLCSVEVRRRSTANADARPHANGDARTERFEGSEMSTHVAVPHRPAVVPPQTGQSTHRLGGRFCRVAWSLLSHSWGAWPFAYGSALVARELRR